MGRTLTFLFTPIVACLAILQAMADDKPKADANVPRVVLALPLGISPSTTTKVTLRGMKLDTVESVEVSGSLTAKILSKGKADVPAGLDASRVGDTQIELEIAAPAELPDEFTVVAVTPAGKSAAHRLLVNKGLAAANDKEPNGGFRQAAPLAAGQYVDGLVERNTDVDVYRIDGKAGEKISVEVLAARHGSPFDGLLTIYDAAGRSIATGDDAADHRDPHVEVTLPADGPIFIALQDANDQGGSLHAYRLVVAPR